jgi:hypothetical protein
VRQEVIRNEVALSPQLADGAVEIDGVPMHQEPRLQTNRFNFGEALKRTVLLAFTLIGSPVRGLRAVRALRFATVTVPKPGSVNLPSRFSSVTIAAMTSPATAFATVPDKPAVSCSTPAMNTFDITTLLEASAPGERLRERCGSQQACSRDNLDAQDGLRAIRPTCRASRRSPNRMIPCAA